MKRQTILSFGTAIFVLLLISAGPVQAEWRELDKVTAYDGAASDYFGWSVSISGDYALAGADNDDIDVNSNQGSAYIFKRDGTAWTEEAKLTASDGAGGDYFGCSVSVSGDYAIVGSRYDDSSRGSAFVFIRGGKPWV